MLNHLAMQARQFYLILFVLLVPTNILNIEKYTFLNIEKDTVPALKECIT